MGLYSPIECCVPFEGCVPVLGESNTNPARRNKIINSRNGHNFAIGCLFVQMTGVHHMSTPYPSSEPAIRTKGKHESVAEGKNGKSFESITGGDGEHLIESMKMSHSDRHHPQEEWLNLGSVTLTSYPLKESMSTTSSLNHFMPAGSEAYTKATFSYFLLPFTKHLLHKHQTNKYILHITYR